MPSHLLNTTDLQQWLGFSQIAPVERFLRKYQVPYWTVSGRPVTTLEAVNKRLLEAKEKGEAFEFEGYLWKSMRSCQSPRRLPCPGSRFSTPLTAGRRYLAGSRR